MSQPGRLGAALAAARSPSVGGKHGSGFPEEFSSVWASRRSGGREAHRARGGRRETEAHEGPGTGRSATKGPCAHHLPSKKGQSRPGLAVNTPCGLIHVTKLVGCFVGPGGQVWQQNPPAAAPPGPVGPSPRQSVGPRPASQPHGPTVHATFCSPKRQLCWVRSTEHKQTHPDAPVKHRLLEGPRCRSPLPALSRPPEDGPGLWPRFP